MYDIIKKFVENENDNGILLMDMPTGSGKTTKAGDYIYDSCMKPENKDRKYIFVTTLKKNLPFEDMRNRFERDGKKELYNEKVLVIDSNLDSVINGWSSEVENSIPYEIKNTDEYKEFHSNLNFVKKQREDKNLMLREFLASIETNLREKAEPKFRRMISEMLGKEYSTVERKMMAIKINSRWQWVGKLYPAVFTRDRQILFMSMDKFLSRNTTIVEPSYMFYNSDLIKNAVIFIDEFDATKETILRNIIDNGLRDRVNYVELFKDIYSALQTDSFPRILTTPSRERIEGKYKEQSLESIIDGIKEKAEYIYSLYNLQYKHKTSGDLSDDYKNYLFQDHQFHAILNANNSYITMFSDDEQRINTIGFSSDKPNRESSIIQTMLGQLRGFIAYFQGAVNILAINYMQLKNENRTDGEDIFSMEASIRSVLALFRLNDYSIDYLTGQIMMSAHKVKGKIEPADFDLSFYENGFRYYAFENNTEHDMQSQIRMFSFQTTPEKILMRFCEKAKVIGISATATVPSVIGNYDIDYLKNKMQKVYVELSDSERKRLADSFNEQQKEYEKITILTELLGDCDNYSWMSWTSVFKTDELSRKIYEKIQIKFGDGEDRTDYLKKRYLRISQAFKQFVIHDDIYSFLCVLNKHPKSKDRFLDKDTLYEIFDYIAHENGWDDYDNQRMIVFLDGAEYEDKKNTLIERLSKGEKIFVISVYQTIGAGQNLQYPVPDFLKGKLIKTYDRDMKDEKDFDAIYLDKPTNLIVPLTDNLEETEFVKYLYQMEFLQESCEISARETMINIKKAFKTMMMGHRNDESYSDIYKKKSVILLSTRYIIQAIGRMCRTNQKNKKIYIYADASIAENIDVSVLDGRSFNPEFVALVETIKDIGVKDPEKMLLENKASLISVRVNKKIKNMLNNDWTEVIVSVWKDLRELVLKYPTVSKIDFFSNFIFRNFYIELPEESNQYYYSQDEDYNNVSVSFAKDREHTSKVSAEGTKLYDYLRIPGVKELFEKNGWATTFEPNTYIMSPPLWNNIYKGALGEVVGKYLIERIFKVEVLEIEDPNLFELFDYEIDGSSVYIDFKNWHEGRTENKEEALKKVAEKAKKCGCKCIVIANIFAENSWDVTETDIEDIHIVLLPCIVLDVNGEIKLFKKAVETLQRCINEYKY